MLTDVSAVICHAGIMAAISRCRRSDIFENIIETKRVGGDFDTYRNHRSSHTASSLISLYKLAVDITTAIIKSLLVDTASLIGMVPPSSPLNQVNAQ